MYDYNFVRMYKLLFNMFANETFFCVERNYGV